LAFFYQDLATHSANLRGLLPPVGSYTPPLSMIVVYHNIRYPRKRLCKKY